MCNVPTDFVYISNIATAHILALTNLLTSQTAAGHAFFITNGQPITLRALCLAVWKEFEHVPSFSVTVPEWLARCMGFVAECVTGIEGEFCRGVVSDGCRDRYASIEKARRVLGYVAEVGMEEGVRRSCKVSGSREDVGEVKLTGGSLIRRGLRRKEGCDVEDIGVGKWWCSVVPV
jgi:sterol-4alpha-carboxylate 3-dehydrogenase (decarboxylating)